MITLSNYEDLIKKIISKINLYFNINEYSLF